MKPLTLTIEQTKNLISVAFDAGRVFENEPEASDKIEITNLLTAIAWMHSNERNETSATTKFIHGKAASDG